MVIENTTYLYNVSDSSFILSTENQKYHLERIIVNKNGLLQIVLIQELENIDQKLQVYWKKSNLVNDNAK